MTKYTLTLLFPNSIDKKVVTQVNYQVTADPALQPPLPQNKMPALFTVDDTLTFTYKRANPQVNLDSSLLTRYNIQSSEKEVDSDFINEFDKPIPITPSFMGTWIFHLLGMYKINGTNAAYYLDPEFTGGQ